MTVDLRFSEGMLSFAVPISCIAPDLDCELMRGYAPLRISRRGALNRLMRRDRYPFSATASERRDAWDAK